MARVFMSDKHWRVEKGFYRVVGIDPEADQRWGTYARSMLAFSGVCVLFLYLLERVQHWLPYSNGMPAVPSFLAWNTAASFVTNTNWQNYSGESTMGYTVQMAGLAVQNFVSAAVGIVVVIALIRGFMRNKTDRLGNFWVDTTRIVIRVLLPLSVIGGIILMATGVIDNFNLTHVITTLTGGQQTMVGGPVASQEVIKELGNNGGGFFNANSVAPVREPEPVLQLVRDLPAARHPVRAAAHLRQDGRRQPAGLPARRRDGRAVAGRGRRHQLLRVAARGHRPAGRARRDGGQGGQVRHPRLVVVRRIDDRDLDRSGQLASTTRSPRSAAGSSCST